MKTPLYPLEQYIHAGELPVKVVFYEQKVFSIHYHDYVELVFVLSGYGKHICENEKYSIARGDVFVIKPGVKHGYCDMHDLAIVNVLIDFSSNEIVLNDLKQIPGFYALFEVEPLLRARKKHFPRLRLSTEDLTTVCQYLEEIKTESEQQQPGYRFAALNSFSRLLLLVSRSYEQPRQKPTENMMRLSKMLQFMEKNYMRDISRDEIVQSAFLSSSSGSRIFQQMLGKTIIEALTQIRIDHAAERLRRNEKVTDAALACGFRDSNYFATVFHRLMGETPSKYRNEVEEMR